MLGVWVPSGTVLTYVRKPSQQSALQIIKKAGVHVIMPTWLVHIKEHVWTIRTCPTTILLPTRYGHMHNVYMCECAALMAEKEKRYCLIWDGRPVYSPGCWSKRWLPSITGTKQKIIRADHEWISHCNKFVKCTKKLPLIPSYTI